MLLSACKWFAEFKDQLTFKVKQHEKHHRQA